jgi:hypothetical protein
MKKVGLQRLVFLLALVISPLSMAGQVMVQLDAPSELIKRYSAYIMFGISYTDGSGAGTTLFETAELKQGINEKPFFIDDNKQLNDCSYQWLIVSQMPGEPIDPSKVELLMPIGFDGVVRGNCQVDLEHGLIKLSLGSWNFESLIFHLDSEAEAQRQAKFFRADAKILVPDQIYRSFNLPFNLASTDPPKIEKRILFSDQPQIEVKSYWRKEGRLITDQTSSAEFDIVIR